MSSLQKSTRRAKLVPIYDVGDTLTNKILNGDELGEKEEIAYNRMTQIFTILSSHERNKARTIIKRMLDIPNSTVPYWIRRTEDFFGEINEIRVETERIRQKMRLEALLYDPRTKVDEMIKIEKLLMELIGTKKEDGGGEPKKQRPVFVFHNYTSDPSALHQEKPEEGQYQEANE